MARILGVDYGGRHIGLSMSDESETLASGLETVRNDGLEEAAEKILGLASVKEVAEIVVGWPVGMKGQMTEETREVSEFIDQLKRTIEQKGLEMKVDRFDERLTSKAAAELIGDERGVKDDIHMRSANIILQNYLDGKRRG
jgi:putative Holliday junction resolvase